MTKSFKERVLRERIVDTRKYRYIVTFYPESYIIKRLPIEYLGTTAAYTEWEVIE